MSDSLRPHGLQQTRLPCPSPTPRACSNSRPLTPWCRPTIILCHPLLLLSIFPSIRVFSNESVLCIRWPKYWSFSTTLLLLLLLLSPFSHVWLCATPYRAAHQAPPSQGFSWQEHWSGLPFPSPMHESEKWKWSRSVVMDCSLPGTVAYQAPLSMGFSRQEYWSGLPFPSPINIYIHTIWC